MVDLGFFTHHIFVFHNDGKTYRFAIDMPFR